MNAFSRFEDIIAWKKSREISLKIFKLTQSSEFNSDIKLRTQMRGSSGSIMDNIAEGYGRGGNREFKQFLWISKGSAVELKSQLYRCFDRKWLSEDGFNKLYEDVEEVEKIISGLINHLSNSETKGRKYNNK